MEKSIQLFHILHNDVDSMENSKKFRPDPKLRLMDQIRGALRYNHWASCQVLDPGRKCFS